MSLELRLPENPSATLPIRFDYFFCSRRPASQIIGTPATACVEDEERVWHRWDDDVILGALDTAKERVYGLDDIHFLRRTRSSTNQDEIKSVAGRQFQV